MRKITYFFSKKNTVKYNEIYADSEIFEKFYEIERAAGSELMVIPDGSIDIQCLWKDNTFSMYVCGSVSVGKLSRIQDFDKCFGGRFKIGVLPEAIKNRLGEIINNRVELGELMDVDGLCKYLKKNLLLEQKADILLNVFDVNVNLEKVNIINALVKIIEKSRGHVNVSEIVNRTGYSHRYVNYVFKDNVGVSIKKYASIVRLQESLVCLVNDDSDLIYEELGYYDQAHFIKEFKKFTSVTPKTVKQNASELKFM